MTQVREPKETIFRTPPQNMVTAVYKNKTHGPRLTASWKAVKAALSSDK
jgi:hypothetical protein